MAAIVDLCEYRLSHRFRPHDTNARSLDIVREGITRTIMDDYAGLPIPAITLATNEVTRVLSDTDGKTGSFTDAVEAAAAIMRPYLSSCFLWELKFLKLARFRVVERNLQYCREEKIITMDEYSAAVTKARTMTDGGACIIPTLCQVLGEKFSGRVVS